MLTRLSSCFECIIHVSKTNVAYLWTERKNFGIIKGRCAFFKDYFVSALPFLFSIFPAVYGILLLFFKAYIFTWKFLGFAFNGPFL